MDWMNSNWFWWGLALALFALEAVMPGTFMLWLGIAAIGTAIVHVVLPGLDPTMQWISFAILSLLAVAAGWRYRQSHTPTPSDQPLLNRRAEQLIGRVYPLDTAIVDGRGRLKIGDAFWMVSGPDLAAGTRVRVIGVDGMELRIDPAG
jgi:inner membrane protein